jgi:glucose-1-phosphate thymidylyltransferase
MKGIILHGGYGTRLRPLTHTGPKQLLPIANKPMSQYALEDLKDAGITEIGIVIGDVYPEKVQEYYGDGSKFGVKIQYIHQESPRGISHAIKLCRDFVGDEKFIVYLGDNVLRKGLSGYKKQFESSTSDALILLCDVDNPSKFGVAKFDNGNIIKIIEKPIDPPSNFAVIGVYFLSPKIFNIIEKLKPSKRGELEITDALQCLIDENNSIEHEFVTGWWKDTGTPDDILHANQLILDSIGKENQFLIDKDAILKNNSVIGKNTTISKDSIIIDPIIIGENCTIGPSVTIGPYVSVGKNSILTKCKLENSIIMDECVINSDIFLSGSIIAYNSTIEDSKLINKTNLLLGERSKLQL